MSETWQVSCFTNKTASSISRTTLGGEGGKKKKENKKKAAGNNAAAPAINPPSLAAARRCLPAFPPYIHPTRRGTFPTLSRGSALISEEKKREQKRPEKYAV